MRRLIEILFILLISLFMTGCRKDYKTISEYSDTMNKIKNKSGDYILEGELNSYGYIQTIKSYMKDNTKWKTEFSENNGATYDSGVIFDGTEVLFYDIPTKSAIALPHINIPFIQHMSDNELATYITKAFNPVGYLFNWDFQELNRDINQKFVFGKLSEKNNYPCRMIYSKEDFDEICINDKYGIGVYAKFASRRNGYRLIINIKNISNENIPDDIMRLPQGIEKKNAESLFQDMISFKAKKL